METKIEKFVCDRDYSRDKCYVNYYKRYLNS